jgi:hypothetical protein
MVSSKEAGIFPTALMPRTCVLASAALVIDPSPDSPIERRGKLDTSRLTSSRT